MCRASQFHLCDIEHACVEQVNVICVILNMYVYSKSRSLCDIEHACVEQVNVICVILNMYM